MDKLTASVALCTCNGSAFVREQVASILNQTVSIGEIIVCDDCSADDTFEITKGLLEEGFTGRYVIERNAEQLGVGKNFQKCIGLCSGDIVFLCDQDDVWKPDRVERVLSCFADEGVVLAFNDAETIDSDGTILLNSLFDSWGVLNPAWKDIYLEDMLARVGRNPNGCLVAFRRRSLQPFLSNKWCDWHDGWIMMVAALAGGYAFVDEPLVKYRIHDSNLTASPRKQEEYIRKVQGLDEFDRHFELHEFRINRCKMYAEVVRLSNEADGRLIKAYEKSSKMCETLQSIKEMNSKGSRVRALCASVIRGEYRYRYRDSVKPYGLSFRLRLCRVFCSDIAFLLLNRKVMLD